MSLKIKVEKPAWNEKKSLFGLEEEASGEPSICWKTESPSFDFWPRSNGLLNLIESPAAEKRLKKRPAPTLSLIWPFSFSLLRLLLLGCLKNLFAKKYRQQLLSFLIPLAFEFTLLRLNGTFLHLQMSSSISYVSKLLYCTGSSFKKFQIRTFTEGGPWA